MTSEKLADCLVEVLKPALHQIVNWLLESQREELRRQAQRLSLSNSGQTIEFLNAEEVAELFRVSPRHIYELVSKEKIPFHSIGPEATCIRFMRSELVAWSRDCATKKRLRKKKTTTPGLHAVQSAKS